ncbi:MAG TPA: hypothetical protein VGB98_06180 [Pyrinomonadaceae bacterium]
MAHTTFIRRAFLAAALMLTATQVSAYTNDLAGGADKDVYLDASAPVETVKLAYGFDVKKGVKTAEGEKIAKSVKVTKDGAYAPEYKAGKASADSAGRDVKGDDYDTLSGVKKTGENYKPAYYARYGSKYNAKYDAKYDAKGYAGYYAKVNAKVYYA